ncbi:uncharacterized protein LOC123290808 [Chrysoperla carnea]|uniref:uncharacterized protein LOC123290808 n=1 Tax=Chrysoperla carnea TaxID=189513 RepID=UPI001D06D99C|nr:uncharacterized protein LOC123290808 [Chrysoperla carnea]
MFFKEQLFLLFLTINQINCEDVTVTLNLKRALHVVSDQFISFNVDPKYFFQNVNLSDSENYNIISALSPAFIRLSGPSTKVLTWADPDKLGTDNDHLLTGLYGLTPKKWIDFNEWALNTNLTPIFALNDRHRINGVWDPRDSLAMMTITDQMNYSCFWELGYDGTNTTLNQYISDLTSLQHILDAFPASKDYWGTIGSDFSGCIEKPTFEVIRNFLLSVESSLDAINWHIKNNGEEKFLTEKDPIVKALMPTAKTKLPVMLTIPYADKTASFRNALEWALELGNAAKFGFGVVFRQPTKVELLKETPVFWVGLLHKNLLGRNILDVKVTGTNRTRSQVYGHCTKRQNNYIRRGAVTLFAINTQKTNMSIALRPFGPQMRSVEIQSYVLTSNGNIEDSEIFLNNEKLTYDVVSRTGKLDLIPKIRRARANKIINLELPPLSIGFFVLPGARSPACIVGEIESELIVEEIIEDQNAAVDVERTANSKEEDVSLPENSEESFETEEKPIQAQWEKILHTKSKDPKLMENYNFTRQHFIDRAKLLEKHKQLQETEQHRLDLKHKLAEKIRKQETQKQAELDRLQDFELTSDEIQLILAQRDKKNVKLRAKRFLPIDIMKSFAERAKKESNKNDKVDVNNNPPLKSRTKRQITFDEGRYSGRRNSRLAGRLERLRNRKETVENDQYNPNNNYGLDQPSPPPTDIGVKPIKVIPQGDVFMGLLTESVERNNDYDYLESEEHSPRHTEPQFRNTNQQRKSKIDRRNRKNGKTVAEESTTGVIDGRFLEDFNIYTMAENANEWSIMDGDDNDQLFHAGHFYENLHNNPLHIGHEIKRTEWKDYGELFEVDSLKDSDEEDEISSLENYYGDFVENKNLYPVEKFPQNYVEDVQQSITESEESNESDSRQEHEKLQGQDSQKREVRVLPDRNFLEQNKKIDTTRNNNYFKDNSITRSTTSTTSMPVTKKKRKPSTPIPELRPLTTTTTTSTTTSTTPFPLYTPQQPKRRRPRPPQDDIPDYMRFKRDVSNIQKIPPKHQAKSVINPNNIQTITPKNTKSNGNDVKRAHRRRRDADTTSVFDSETITTEAMVTEYETTTASIPSIDDLDDVSNMDAENDVDYVEPNEEHFKYVIGRPYDSTKLKPLNEKRSNNFQRFLKNRLARTRKRFEKKNQAGKVKTGMQNDTTIIDNIETTNVMEVETTTTAIPTTDVGNKLNEQDSANIDPTIIRHKTGIENLRRRRQFTPLADHRMHIRNFLRNRFGKNKRSIEMSDRENEIFENSEEELNKNGHVYKIKTQQGKKIMVFDTAKAAHEFENKYTGSKEIVDEKVVVFNLFTTETPLALDLIENKWSDSSASDNNDDDSSLSHHAETAEEIYSLNSDSSGSDTFDDKDTDSWGDLSDNNEGDKKKIIIVTGHPFQPFSPFGGNQLVGNFLETISKVLERVHKRLSGYFTAL